MNKLQYFLKNKELSLNNGNNNFQNNKNPIVTGLQSIGYNNGMNATLQVLSNIPVFTTYFLTKYKIDPSKPISNQIYYVLHNLWNNNSPFYYPNDFS